jgi:hypothetical protein
VTRPVEGAVGVPKGISIITVEDAREVHPDPNVTVKL